MRNARRLTLRRETLAPLSDHDMSVVNGGSHACGVTHGWSFDGACPVPTLPVNDCVDCLRSGSCTIQTR